MRGLAELSAANLSPKWGLKMVELIQRDWKALPRVRCIYMHYKPYQSQEPPAAAGYYGLFSQKGRGKVKSYRQPCKQIQSFATLIVINC